MDSDDFRQKPRPRPDTPASISVSLVPGVQNPTRDEGLSEVGGADLRAKGIEETNVTKMSSEVHQLKPDLQGRCQEALLRWVERRHLVDDEDAGICRDCESIGSPRLLDDSWNYQNFGGQG